MNIIDKEKDFTHLSQVDRFYEEISYAQKHSKIRIQKLKEAVKKSLKAIS
ncbi:hypothetical protein MNB_SV-13-1203 [hydrothermal vent metagenome]|uniref:Uncharacterized protein n=1 Tax=hydrothermal vent metagenome TaxID=652676 RepID=A0A1W1CVK9_9ZZZZ